MKTKDSKAMLAPCSDSDISASVLQDDQRISFSEKKKDHSYPLSSVDYHDMGEVIRRWESSRYGG